MKQATKVSMLTCMGLQPSTQFYTSSPQLHSFVGKSLREWGGGGGGGGFATKLFGTSHRIG